MTAFRQVRIVTSFLVLLLGSTLSQEPPNAKPAKQYSQWLHEDVGSIITEPELIGFRMLKRDEERDNFIEAFWRRRDPTPETEENEFENEHYRRIVYANERFSSFVPGWKTDRGRIYILFGPPDEVSAETGTSPPTDYKPASLFHIEIWRYRYLEGFGQEVEFRFVDDCNCGEFRLLSFPDRKEYDHVIVDPVTPSGIQRSPQVRFKNLEEVVTSKVRYNLLPFAVRTNALRATHFTDWLSLTIQLQQRNLIANEETGESWIHLQVFARITTSNGRVAQTIEDEIRRPMEQAPAAAEDMQFSRFVPLRPGDYRLSVVVYDVNADRMGTFYQEISLPTYPDAGFTISPLILADRAEAITPREHLMGRHFDVGDTRIHLCLPKTGSSNISFAQAEQVWLFMQVYGLATDLQDKKSHAAIRWDLVKADTGKVVRSIQETNADSKEFGEEITLCSSIRGIGLKAGRYDVRVTVTDEVAQRTAVQSSPIVIE